MRPGRPKKAKKLTVEALYAKILRDLARRYPGYNPEAPRGGPGEARMAGDASGVDQPPCPLDADGRLFKRLVPVEGITGAFHAALICDVNSSAHQFIDDSVIWRLRAN
jgi:hypothetical protein